MNYHPHIHYGVAGGAWSKTGNSWHPCRADFYVPHKALSRIYRAKFRDLMRDATLNRLVDPGVFQKGWNVNIQPVGAAEHSIRYLSHDVFKVAISDHRIVQAADDTVTFSCKKPKSRRTRYMTLNALDFMSRFLQHLLPPGFMKVRGFMHACSGGCLENVRASIEMMHAFEVTVPESNREVHGKIKPVCPDCGAELRYLYSVLPHQMPEYRGSG